MKPMQGLWGETASGSPFFILLRRTIGLLFEVRYASSASDTLQNFFIVSISGDIRAKGLLLFLFLSLSLFTASSFIASQAK